MKSFKEYLQIIQETPVDVMNDTSKDNIGNSIVQFSIGNSGRLMTVDFSKSDWKTTAMKDITKLNLFPAGDKRISNVISQMEVYFKDADKIPSGKKIVLDIDGSGSVSKK